MERNTLARDAVESRRLDDGVSVAPRVRPPPIVSDGEEDMGRPVLRGRCPRNECEKKHAESILPTHSRLYS